MNFMPAITQKNTKTHLIIFRNKHLSQNTISSYRNAVKDFYSFLTERSLSENFESVRMWLDSINNPNSYNLKVQAIKEYLLERFKNEPPEKQLELREQLDSLKRIRIDTAVKESEFISQEQAQLLADNTSDVIAAFVLALFWTGCRISELLNIRIKDCSGTNPVRIRIIGKGRKEREVYLPKDVYMLILEVCKSKEFIFEKKNKKAINMRYTRQYVTLKIAKEAKRVLGLNIDISAHSLRHSKAMHLLETQKLPLNKISRALGHAKTSTTADFYLHGTPDAKEQGIKVYKKEKTKRKR